MALQKFNVHYEQKHNNSIYTSEIIALGLYDLAPFQGGHSKVLPDFCYGEETEGGFNPWM